MTPPQTLPRAALWLGLAGLLPQIVAVGALAIGFESRVALLAGFAYAALILSFLGGIWWGIAVSRPDAPRWLYPVAVVPSLIAFATAILLLVGTGWPGLSLFVLGLALGLSSLVDKRLFALGLIDEGFLGLRRLLSATLGALTLGLAALS